MMVKLSSEPSLNDLDRIQDLFPVDDLFLYDSDPLSPRLKTPTRRRTTPTSRLQRALSGKNKIVPTEKNGERVEHHSDVINKSAHDSSTAKSLLQFQHPNCGRRYVMEAPVQLISGVQSQERHLFLLSDLLIVAKPRASGVYKLKEKVRVAELWLSNSCLEVVCEVAKNGDTAFVLGWPTTNLLVNFSSTHTRDLWLAKLKQLISEEQEKGPESTSIRVHYWDANTKEEYAHNVCVSRKDTVVDCMGNALVQLGLSAEEQAGQYQLWVKSDRDTAPYPLIGHESPLAIKMNCLFTALAVTGEDAFDLDYTRSVHISNCPALKCYFILRSTKRGSFDLVPSKKGKRVKRSPILPKVFRRSLSKPDLSEPSPTRASCQLFGQPLDKLLHNGSLPKALLTMFYALYETGPYTVGIFRKSANARVCRELREKLNFNSDEVSAAEQLASVNIFVLAVLMKDFLRSLPDCLLMCQLYLDWLSIPCLSSDAHRVSEAQRLVSRLPACNEVFLKHFMCVLWHVHARSAENMMTAANLAVCVGPSLLWAKDTPSYSEQTEASKQVPALVDFLITNCRKVFGEDCLTLLNHVKPRDISRQDSGNEESESLHSMQSSHSSGELRRDDSSIDSLERALLGDGEHSPKLPTKAKMSLTNLSRDSGLTMSDTQLYTPDEETEVRSEAQPPAHTRATSSPRRSFPVQARGGTQSPGSERPRSTNCVELKLEPGYWPPTPRAQSLSNGHYTHLRSLVQTPSAPDQAQKPSFPLGGRKEMTKRRLSRSRPLRAPLPHQKTYYGTVSEFPLRRSASEESVLSFAEREPHLGGGSVHWPPNRSALLNNMLRSKSVLRLPETEANGRLEGAYDSSTLSDDDSTPRVSRNNSRSKDAHALYSNVYAGRGPRKGTDAEIHHASPITIDMSDEELDARPPLPPPPLPPKPRRFLSYEPRQDSTDWNHTVRGHTARRPPLLHPTSVISVGGQRVLTSTPHSLYDVPPWRPAERTGRSATISRSGHHRAKSQPPPLQREPHAGNGFHTLSGSYDKNPSNVWKYNNGLNGASASGTVGRSLKKEISWSVSQLKAFFSRNGSKETDEPRSVLNYHNYAPQPPPPYRPPPQAHYPPWGGQCTLRRNAPCKYVSSSDSVSGEESYV